MRWRRSIRVERRIESRMQTLTRVGWGGRWHILIAIAGRQTGSQVVRITGEYVAKGRSEWPFGGLIFSIFHVRAESSSNSWQSFSAGRSVPKIRILTVQRQPTKAVDPVVREAHKQKQNQRRIKIWKTKHAPNERSLDNYVANRLVERI